MITSSHLHIFDHDLMAAPVQSFPSMFHIMHWNLGTPKFDNMRNMLEFESKVLKQKGAPAHSDPANSTESAEVHIMHVSF